MPGLTFASSSVEQITGDLTLEIPISTGDFGDLIVIRVRTIDDLATSDGEVRDKYIIAPIFIGIGCSHHRSQK
jgi:hypothetical protein